MENNTEQWVHKNIWFSEATEIRNKRLIGLFLMGCIVFNYPILSLFNVDRLIFGIPLLYLFIFGVWFIFIFLMKRITSISFSIDHHELSSHDEH